MTYKEFSEIRKKIENIDGAIKDICPWKTFETSVDFIRDINNEIRYRIRQVYHSRDYHLERIGCFDFKLVEDTSEKVFESIDDYIQYIIENADYNKFFEAYKKRCDKQKKLEQEIKKKEEQKAEKINKILNYGD